MSVDTGVLILVYRCCFPQSIFWEYSCNRAAVRKLYNKKLWIIFRLSSDTGEPRSEFYSPITKNEPLPVEEFGKPDVKTKNLNQGVEIPVRECAKRDSKWHANRWSNPPTPYTYTGADNFVYGGGGDAEDGGDMTYARRWLPSSTKNYRGFYYLCRRHFGTNLSQKTMLPWIPRWASRQSQDPLRLVLKHRVSISRTKTFPKRWFSIAHPIHEACLHALAQ